MLALVLCCVLQAAAVVSCGAVVAPQPAIIILPVGDSSTSGDAVVLLDSVRRHSGGRYGVHLSYRRYLYHGLTARGYAVRFAGSLSDCHIRGLDYDPHHEGYTDYTVGQIVSSVTRSANAIRQSILEASSHLDASAPGSGQNLTLITVLSAGARDVLVGQTPELIVDGFLRHLIERINQTVSGIGCIKTHRILIVPSPPPGGMRVKRGSLWTTHRDAHYDSRYEDYRFFLTEQSFAQRSSSAANIVVSDCFSYFDFLRHYKRDGTRLNALGDMAFARCMIDRFELFGLLPSMVPNTTQQRRTVCDKPETESWLRLQHREPVVVNGHLPPLTSIIAPVAVVDEGFVPHPACGAAASSAPPSTSHICHFTPPFPQSEPFMTTPRDIWTDEEQR